jgi:toxin-antitoxin system PIN domain toxin
MSIALLDVNVLIGLLDPAHPSHEEAHEWFSRQRRKGWATSPITLNGCARVLSSPAYLTVEATTAQVVSYLGKLCASQDHHFWEDSLAIIDPSTFVPELIGGHAKITDAYLLALAVRNGGRLATFDRSIPVKAVVGARPDHVELLGRRVS